MIDTNENNMTSPDESTAHNSAAFRRTGTGKAERIAAALAKAVYDESIRQGDPGGFVVVDDIEHTEFIDLKVEKGENNGE